MSDQSAITKFALNDILLGLANGLTEAQQQLRSLPPYDEYGRPNTMYQLPYLDFQLQVTSEFEAIETTTTAPDTTTPATMPAFPVKYGAPKGSFKFSTAKSTQTTSNVEMISTISGRFVANLPNEGMPQVILMVKTNNPTIEIKNGVSKYKIEIEAILSNVVGEKLNSSLIEFNFDADATKAMNADAIIDAPSFKINELRTDANGSAKTEIYINKTDFEKPYSYIILVGSGTITKTIAICKK
jgi:hypothetical protein